MRVNQTQSLTILPIADGYGTRLGCPLTIELL
jgi:hypothetical protein